MRFLGRALVASAFVLGACAGKDKGNPAETARAAAPETAAAAAPAATPGAPAAGAPAAGAPAPVTGATHEVKMVLEGTAYKFDPADITVKAGDAIKFISVSGGPHNVGFNPADVGDQAS